MTQTLSCDVVVVGAGPTGAHAAGEMAKAGLKVALIDRQKQGKAGAQWVNGVPSWMVKSAGLGDLQPIEVYSRDHIFTVIDPTNKARISITKFDLFDVDMRRLGDRTLENALGSDNTQVFFNTTITKLELDSRGRPFRAHASVQSKDQTSELMLNAKLFVDASGLPAVFRKNVPTLDKACVPVAREDLCTAAQEVCEIIDVQAAKDFLEKNHAVPGEILSWVGMAGGYSLMRVQIDHDFREIAFLTGVRALPELPTGAQLIQEFIAKNPWVGAKKFGGQRAVPLRRPYTTLVAPGIALLGDAACQVYSAHGSGVGIGLIAAKLLADVVNAAATSGQDIGSLEALWPYAHRFHKEWGPLLGVSDAFRRFSQGFSHQEVHQLMSSGLMSKGLTRDSLLQHQLQPRLMELPSQLLGALKNPGIVKKAAGFFVKLPLIGLVAKQYPQTPDPIKTAAYEARMQRLIDTV